MSSFQDVIRHSTLMFCYNSNAKEYKIRKTNIHLAKATAKEPSLNFCLWYSPQQAVNSAFHISTLLCILDQSTLRVVISRFGYIFSPHECAFLSFIHFQHYNLVRKSSAVYTILFILSTEKFLNENTSFFRRTELTVIDSISITGKNNMQQCNSAMVYAWI